MKKTQFFLKSVAAIAVCLIGVSVYGGTIVPDLNDSSAFFSANVAYSNTTPSLTVANGLTLAADFTPDATDIANSANGPVAVLEVGGSSNGSGLWIINGYLWYLTKSGGKVGAYPQSTLDLDGSDNAVGVQLGLMSAGAEWKGYVSLDNANHTLLISQSSSVTSYSLTGVGSGWNWKGTAAAATTFALYNSYLNGSDYGRNGGLASLASGTMFSDGNLYNLDGTATLGQAFNAVSAVPEPSTLALGILGGFAGLFLRRRKS